MRVGLAKLHERACAHMLLTRQSACVRVTRTAVLQVFSVSTCFRISLNDIQALTIFLRLDDVREFLSYAPFHLSACMIGQSSLQIWRECSRLHSVSSLNSVPEDEVELRVQKYERNCPCPMRYLVSEYCESWNLRMFFSDFLLGGSWVFSFWHSEMKANTTPTVAPTRMVRVVPTGSTSEEQK